VFLLKRTPLAAFTRLFVFITIVVIFVGYGIERGYENVRRSQAVLVTGYASLAYLHKLGAPPSTVDDLFDRGFVLKVGDQDAKTPGFDLSARLDYVRRVSLAFPASVSDCELRAGIVVLMDSEEKLTCIRFDGERPGRSDWEYLWFCVAGGRPTGDSRLDELLERDVDP